MQALIEAAQADGQQRVAQGARQGRQAASSTPAIRSRTRMRASDFVARLQGGEFARQERRRTTSRSKWARTTGPSPSRSSQKAASWHFDSAAGAEESSTAASAPTSWRPSSPAWRTSTRSASTTCAIRRRIRCCTTPSRLISTEGKKDGLYWPAGENEAQSPLGEGFAQARAEGYCEGRHDEGRAVPRLHLPDADRAGTERAWRRLRLRGQRPVVRRIRG